MMEQVDAAEKEASEVLHSLLSVERIEKQTLPPDEHQQVVVVTSESDLPLNSGNVVSDNQEQGAIQWHTPVTVHQALFANMVGGNHGLSGEQVIWQLNQSPLTSQQHSTICVPSMQTLQTIGQDDYTPPPGPSEAIIVTESVKRKVTKQSNNVQKTTVQKKKQPPQRKSLGVAPLIIDTAPLEENAQQVRERFERGCECQEENCFRGLSPEYVYRHRLNIAELTKGEHDMYLMGVTMAVLTNPDITVRHKERRRLRAQYVFQGRRVCLDAFLYLENCTHYQLKRIRKHVMTHGVAPRVHGNHGKKPHNTFPLTSYRHAASFLRQFIGRHSPGSTSPHLNTAQFKCKSKQNNKRAPLYLPSEITRKTIHNAYREHCDHYEPSIKVMGYSTFRQYMKEQFPHVKFCKLEGGVNKLSGTNNNNQQQNPPMTMEVEINTPMGMEVEIVSQQNSKMQGDDMMSQNTEVHHETQAATLISTAGDVQQVTAIPIVLSQSNSQTDGMVSSGGLPQSQQQQQTTYIVTPVSQILQSPMNPSPATGNNGNAFASYQLTPATPTSYTTQQHITQAQVGTITVANSQTGTYAFTTL